MAFHILKDGLISKNLFCLMTQVEVFYVAQIANLQFLNKRKQNFNILKTKS